MKIGNNHVHLRDRTMELKWEQKLDRGEDFTDNGFYIEISNLAVEKEVCAVVDGIPTYIAEVFDSSNENHRIYPNFDFWKGDDDATKNKSIVGPVVWEFDFWYDLQLTKGQWFSIATLNNGNPTTQQHRPVTVNIVGEYPQITIEHTPQFGSHIYKRLVTSKVETKRWITIRLEFEMSRTGYLDVYMDDRLWATAEIRKLPPFTGGHLGFYGSPDISVGKVMNRNIRFYGLT